MVRDWNLKLLAKKPIYVDNIPIYSPLLSEIAEVGEDKYNTYLLYTTNLLEAMDSEADLKSEYNSMLALISSSDEYLGDYLDALTFFTKLDFDIKIGDTEVYFLCTTLNEYGENMVLHKDNYDQFSNAIKYSNGIGDIETEDEKEDLPDEILESIKAMETIKENMSGQKSEVENITLKDYVSSLANMNGNGLNILNIWDINKFTLYEQLKRGQLKETFEYARSQLLTGLVDPEEIKLEHYIKKID